MPRTTPNKQSRKIKFGYRLHTVSLNKLALHNPQQDKQKHHHKQQQPQNSQQQKGCSHCAAKAIPNCHDSGKLQHFTNICRTENRHSPPNYKQQANKLNNFRIRNQQNQHVRIAAVECESSDDDVYLFQIRNKSNTHTVRINDPVVKSGSTINILDENSFSSIMPKPKLEKSSAKIYLSISVRLAITTTIFTTTIKTRWSNYLAQSNCCSTKIIRKNLPMSRHATSK